MEPCQHKDCIGSAVSNCDLCNKKFCTHHLKQCNIPIDLIGIDGCQYCFKCYNLITSSSEKLNDYRKVLVSTMKEEMKNDI